MADLPSADDILGPAPAAQQAATAHLPSTDDILGPEKAPPSAGMLASLRKLDDKYLGGMGRQAVLAARAVPDAAVGLASMVPDAITSTYQYGKDLANGRKMSPQDFNPFSQQGGYQNPNLPSNQINSALDTVLPSPQTTTEKVAHGVESFMAGAKMPVPGSVATSVGSGVDAAGSALRGGESAASLSPQARGVAPGSIGPGSISPAPQGYGISLPGPTAIPGAPKRGDTNRAADIIKKRLLRDYTPWEEATASVKADNDQGIPTRLTDAGPNTRSTGEILAQKPGEGSTIILNDRNAIAADTKDRVAGRTREALNATPNADSAEDALTGARSANAKRNYEAVRQDSTPVMDPDIWHILEDPNVAKIYQEAQGSNLRARRMLNTAGTTSPPMADLYAQKPVAAPRPNVPEPGVIDTSAMKNPPAAPEPNAPVPGGGETEWVRTGTAPDVRSLDNLQQLMNQKISNLFQAARNGQGGAGNEATALKSLRQQLVDKMKTASPAFKSASESYGDDSEVLEALQRGKQAGKESFFAMDPPQATKYVNGLSDSGQAALRIGVADRLLGAAEMSGRNSNLAADVLGGNRKTELIQTLFGGDEEKFDLFKTALEKENQLFQNNNAIRGGSPTYRRAAAAEDFSDESKLAEGVGKAVSVGSQLHHGWIGAGVHGLIRMMQKATWNPGVAAQAAKILSASDPADALRGLQSMEEAVTAAVPSNLDKAVTGGLKGFQGDNTGNRLKDKYGVMQ